MRVKVRASLTLTLYPEPLATLTRIVVSSLVLLGPIAFPAYGLRATPMALRLP
jgi:hypothetical protein